MNKVKYATFSQVHGTWRFEGFYEPQNQDEINGADEHLAKMKADCEADNGPNSWRSFAFLDEPHKNPAEVTDALLAESMG